MDRGYSAIALGMPVRGLSTPTDSRFASAQLNSWAPTSFLEWKCGIPRIFFEEGVSIDRDAIYHLPLIGKLNLNVSGSDFHKLVFHPGNIKLVAASSCVPVEMPSEKAKLAPAKRVKGGRMGRRSFGRTLYS